MWKYFSILVVVITFSSCGRNQKAEGTDPVALDWAQIELQAKGAPVTMMMWNGDKNINNYMQDYIAPMVKKQYDIDLKFSSGQGPEIVQLLSTEMQAGEQNGQIDLIWINGETFFQLRQINGLYGPWTDKAPNSKFVALDNPFIGTDFQTPIEGYEMPWGNVQMTLIYDSVKTPIVPQTRAELFSFLKAHPGTFTFDNQFTGLTFMKALLIDIAGGKNALAGKFDQEKYNKYSADLWDYIRSLKPYMWRKGEVFPEGVAQMHQLFANGEIAFSMSNNDAEVDSKIAEGLFPSAAKAYVPSFGTIQNSHYLGIPATSGNKAAAMVVANAMISVDAQLRKMTPTVWGDGTVLDMKKLSEADRKKFEQIPGRIHAPKRSEIQSKALMELAPEYMVKLAADFRKQIIENH